ncbi:MAG: hypothetical protein U9Q80_03475 [Bacillota bacterium]|nr:hypothetical protein [Bacillota bacterium]
MVFNEVIKEYIEYNFGGNVKIQFWDVQKLLPIYLSVSYRYFEIEYLG